MNTIALILSIIALCVSIAALVVALKKEETLIEVQSKSDSGSNKASLEDKEALIDAPGGITALESPYRAVDDMYVVKERKGGEDEL